MPNFIYERDIPDSTHNPSNDQPDMKINTNSTDSLISVDHYGFNNNVGGSHKQVTLTNIAPPGLGEGNGVLFASLELGNSWPSWQNSLGANLMMSGPTTSAANGNVSLPGGVLFQWGVGTTTAGTGTVTYPIAFTTIYSFVLTRVISGATRVFTQIAGTGIGDSSTDIVMVDFNSNGITGTFYWLAIGSKV